jgi:DNA-binding transcriptional LysR family regulator
MRVITRIADDGSFTLMARRMSMSTAAASRAIAG